MYMSVPIGSCGSYDPVITLKPLWGSLGTELSTWSTGSLCCIRAIQHSRFASRPLRSYTAIQRYSIQRCAEQHINIAVVVICSRVVLGEYEVDALASTSRTMGTC